MKAYSIDLRQKISRACEQPSGSQRAIAAFFEALEQAGSRLLYLPPYAPELSPIERCWSQLKTALRVAKHALASRWTTPLSKPSPRSLSRIPTAGSCIAAMPYSDLRTAIGFAPFDSALLSQELSHLFRKIRGR
jgi:hypothetical protein